MNYFKHYNQLIIRCKNRVLETYTENHHIVPRCMGGGDDADNIVSLTPEEHYVAHQLLTKMYPKNAALAKAAMMMTVNRSSNKIYGWLRKRHAKAMSECQTGERNSQFGKSWYHNTVTKERRTFYSNNVPEGWIKGRSILMTKRCVMCGDNFDCSVTEQNKYCSKKCRANMQSNRMKGNVPSNIINLSDEQVNELINRYRNGESVSKIHNDYGIGQRKAYYIIKHASVHTTNTIAAYR